MPYEWIDPEIFIIHGGVVVYHVYKDDDFLNSGPRLYHYCLEACESMDGGDKTFDVRELLAWQVFDDTTNEQLRIQAAIKYAINNGHFDHWEKDEVPVKNFNLNIDSVELATILAALRYWADRTSGLNRKELGYDHFDQHEPLADDQIDILCQQLNHGKEHV